MFPLQMAGVIDDSAIIELGKLKAVGYVVTGHISNHGNNNLVEVQIIRLQDGEVVCSKTTSISVN